MTHVERGNSIATDVWRWIQTEKKMQLVPWVDDPIKMALQEGRDQCLDDLEDLIIRKSEEYDRLHTP